MAWQDDLRAKFAKYQCQSVFHFTDEANLPSIRACGGLLSLEQLRKRGVRPPKPGGNEWSHDADEQRGLHRYVHLCLRDAHPMEYTARQEGRISSTRFLSIDLQVLFGDGVLFSPDVSNKAGVETKLLANAVDDLDLEILCTRTDWSKPDIYARRQMAEKSEILVPHFVASALIRNL